MDNDPIPSQFLADRYLRCDTDSILICGKGIDNVHRSIRTDINNVLATLPGASVQSQIGRMFSANFETRDVVQTLIVQNPAESGRILYLDSVFGGVTLLGNLELNHQSNLSIIIYRDTSITGTPHPLQNLNFGFPDNSAMIVTSSTVIPSSTIVAQATQVIGFFSLDFSGKIIVPPGHDIAVSTFFELVPAQLRVIRVTVTWYELDLPVK